MYKEDVIRLVVLILITILLIGCIIGTVEFFKFCNEKGNEYYWLAYNSPDIPNAILYLSNYRDAIVKNNLDTGTMAIIFKNKQADMSFRVAKLNNGIKFLEDLQSSTNSNKDQYNFMATSTMKNYVESLNVGIPNYFMANNFWIILMIAGIPVLGIFEFIWMFVFFVGLDL